MKSLITIALASSITFSSAFAGIRQDVEALGSLAMGVSSQKVTGKDAGDILRNFMADGEPVFKEAGEMDYADEVEYGLTSTKSAMEMKDFLITALDESVSEAEGLTDPEELARVKETKKQIKDLTAKWDGLVKKLERQGAKFGYSGSGPGYCGISFVELLVVDEKAQTVYEVYLSLSGEC